MKVIMFSLLRRELCKINLFNIYYLLKLINFLNNIFNEFKGVKMRLI